MPCLFIVCPGAVDFPPDAGAQFQVDLNNAAGSNVEVHFSTAHYLVMSSDGTLVPASDVHVFVIGFERMFRVKAALAKVIHAFLMAQKLGSNTDITFLDCFSGDFFVGGVEVKGGRERDRGDFLITESLGGD